MTNCLVPEWQHIRVTVTLDYNSVISALRCLKSIRAEEISCKFYILFWICDPLLVKTKPLKAHMFFFVHLLLFFGGIVLAVILFLICLARCLFKSKGLKFLLHSLLGCFELLGSDVINLYKFDLLML